VLQNKIPPSPGAGNICRVIWGENMKRGTRKGENSIEKGRNMKGKGTMKLKDYKNAKEGKIMA
jgi:hypothetical protein